MEWLVYIYKDLLRWWMVKIGRVLNIYPMPLLKLGNPIPKTLVPTISIDLVVDYATQ